MVALPEDLRNLIELGPKDEKEAFLREFVPPLLRPEGRFTFLPSDEDKPPYDAALDWTIHATHEIRSDGKVLAPAFASTVRSLTTECKPRELHQVVELVGNHISDCFVRKTFDARNNVGDRLRSAVYNRAYWELPTSVRADYDAAHAVQHVEGCTAPDLYVADMRRVIEVRYVMHRISWFQSAAGGKRFEIVLEDARKHSWVAR